MTTPSMYSRPNERSELVHNQAENGIHANHGPADTCTTRPIDRSLLFLMFCVASASALLTTYASKSNAILADQGLIHAPPLGAKHRKQKHDDDKEDYSCKDDISYSSRTVKTAFEMPFAALFKDKKGVRKFEASSIVKVDDEYYSICDSSWAISKFTASSLTPFSDENVMIGDPNREADEDSGYEAISYHNGSFYVIRESVEHVHDDSGDLSTYHAIIEELDINENGDDYNIRNQCRCEFEFEGDSKGFEGAFGFADAKSEFYIVGLCEGNHCSQKKMGRERGHGRLVVMKKNVTGDSNGGCLWETVRIIHIPKSVNFMDYSDISVRPDGKVAITSQEDSALWIGQIDGIKDGILRPEQLGFIEDDEYDLYQFPLSDKCKKSYCNVEGITFINDDMVMAVSDKMKGKGKQPFHCFEKDQSVHVFALPS